jgi:hypothetical protein
MNKTFRIVWAALLLLSLSGNGQAYEFAVPGCKTVQNWVPLYGKCNAAGVLDGSGAALYYNLLTRGQFKDGLPEGKHEFYLGDVSNFHQKLRTKATSEITDWWAFLTMYPEVAQITKSATPPGACRSQGNSDRVCEQKEGRNSFCSISFKAGVVEAKEISCDLYQMAFSEIRRQSLRYEILPFDGKVRLEALRDKSVALVADVPELTLSSDYHTELFGRRSIAIKGVADSVELRSGGVTFKGIIGDYSANVGRKNELLINGYLNAECEIEGRCKVAEMEFKPQVGPVDSRYLTSRSIRGKKYLYVMQSLPKGYMSINRKTGLGYVYYFKAPDGFEFDGSEGNCPGGGKAILVESNDILDVQPICGKVTSPNGQTFTGKFDQEGRPLVN